MCSALCVFILNFQAKYCFPKLLGPAQFSPTPFSDIMSYICKTNSIFTKFHKIFTLCIILWAPQQPGEVLKFACNKVILCAVRAFLCVFWQTHTVKYQSPYRNIVLKISLYSSCVPTSQASQPLICFLPLQVCFFQKCRISRTIQYVDFYVELLSLSKMCLIFVHVVAWTYTLHSFLPLSVDKFIVWL